jgi:IS30 family transposase
MLIIHVRPTKVEDRLFPVHWEGDLIKGEGNASTVSTIVERASPLLMLINLPHPKPVIVTNALQAFTDKLCAVGQPLRKTLTYDQGKELRCTSN